MWQHRRSLDKGCLLPFLRVAWASMLRAQGHLLLLQGKGILQPSTVYELDRSNTEHRFAKVERLSC